jgi:hypothetical protein
MNQDVTKNKNTLLYVLLGLLAFTLMLTNVLHDNIVDAVLTVINTILIVKILLILLKSGIASVNAICNP